MTIPERDQGQVLSRTKPCWSQELHDGGSRGAQRPRRVDVSGNLDPSFEHRSRPQNNTVIPAIVAPDGRIVYAQVDPSGTRLHRTTADGAADGNFTPPVLTGRSDGLRILGDGKMVIGGDFDSADGGATTSPQLARLPTPTDPSTPASGGRRRQQHRHRGRHSGGRKGFSSAEPSSPGTIPPTPASCASWQDPEPAAADTPSFQSAYAAGTFSVVVPTQPGSQYTLRSSPPLSSKNWTPASPVVPGDGTVKTLSHATATAPAASTRSPYSSGTPTPGHASAGPAIPADADCLGRGINARCAFRSVEFFPGGAGLPVLESSFRGDSPRSLRHPGAVHHRFHPSFTRSAGCHTGQDP